MESLKPLVNFAGTDLLQRVTNEYRQNKEEEIKELNLTKGCMELNDRENHIKLSSRLKKTHGTVKMMPGGSVIGCPKINTLNLLNNQEKENRNIYTGSFGYIKFNGDMRFNIIIRSILNFKNISEISVASGVVVDSNANHEFNENFLKAKALIDLFK